MSANDALGPKLSRGDSKRDFLDDGQVSPTVLESQDIVIEARPPLDYTSFFGFCNSLWRRFCSIWTKRFILSLLAGQLVSLCITCTNVTTTELVDRNWSLPTTQTWFL